MASPTNKTPSLLISRRLPITVSNARGKVSSGKLSFGALLWSTFCCGANCPIVIGDRKDNWRHRVNDVRVVVVVSSSSYRRPSS